MKLIFLVSIVISFYLNSETHFVSIDAGSGGSRVFIYQIKENGQITQKKYKKIKTGLSMLLDSPQELSSYIRKLLDFAESALNGYDPAEIPLVLQATGGLRALHPMDQSKLMNLTQQELDKSLFKAPKAEIISGETEGRYQFKTINYLSQDPAAIIELGGASIQVAHSDGLSGIASQSIDGYGANRAWIEFGKNSCGTNPLNYETCKTELNKQLTQIKPAAFKGTYYLVDHFVSLAKFYGKDTLSQNFLDSKGQETCAKSTTELRQIYAHVDNQDPERMCFFIAHTSAILQQVGIDPQTEMPAIEEIGETHISW